MKRSLLLVAVATLAACATYGPTAYRQAAPAYVPVAPPPAYTPGFAPGTPAAPTYTPAGAGLYQPDGAHAAPVERSPNKRVVPATAEPGIWAADGDPALSAGGNKADGLPVRVAGVEVPSRFNKSDAALRTCGAVVSDALGWARGTQTVSSLAEPSRTCTVYRMMIECLVNGGRYEQARLRKGREESRALTLVYANALEYLKWKRDGLCADVPTPPVLNGLTASVNKRVKSVVYPGAPSGFKMVTIDESEINGDDEE